MKTCTTVAIVLVLGVLAGPRTYSDVPDKLPPGMIHFRGAAVPQVLAVYKTLVKMELITDSRVQKLRTPITMKNEDPVSEGQAATLIEVALLDQAGVVLTHLDGRKVSVTYNDALPIASNSK
jgi:hypothetical protein